MRIVIVNWAPIHLGAARGGGVNGYCQSLAGELVGRGHEVISLCGGTAFDRATSGREEEGGRDGGAGQGGKVGECGACRIEERPPWNGVRVFEVVNSPVLAPSLAQFREPLGEIDAPGLEAAIAELMSGLRPDVVHWNNIEGFSAGCIGAVRRGAPAARIVYSLHNYHTICPQVYLMQGHRRPCFGFDQGHACVNCIPAPDPADERERIMRAPPRPTRPSHSAASSSPAPPTAVSMPAGSEAGTLQRGRVQESAPGRAGLKEMVRGLGARLLGARNTQEEAWPPRFIPGRGPHPFYAEDVPAWRPLLNIVQPEPPSDTAPNEYARRRGAMVAMLNSCNRVLAVSDFVKRKFESMGVRPEVLATLHIGSRMTELAARALGGAGGEAGARRPRTDWSGPIRMAFMGYNNWYKGLPMLADALELLTPEVLGRIHLHVYALEGWQMEPQFRLLEPKLGGLTLRHGYRYEEIPELLAGIDLGLVTSVWWDNGPQTVMEFFACGVPVLAAELGGIPDFVRDGENGVLFRGNDRWDLARRLAWLTAHPEAIGGLRARVEPPLSMSEHAAALESLYGDRLS